MAKKCIPGVICIENMTLLLLFILAGIICYFYYILVVKIQKIENNHKYPLQPAIGISSRMVDDPKVIMNPYGPPLRNDGAYFPRDSADQPILVEESSIPMARRGVPINIETRGLSMDYTQLGILTKEKGGEPLILSLMGRRLTSGLDKWQYYTISNTGNMNTKLPISVKGRSCSGEYGCDPIYNGDMVYVEGYNDLFRVTVYENSRFNYIPLI
jgi:Family of unknown function (DUF5755)